MLSSKEVPDGHVCFRPKADISGTNATSELMRLKGTGERLILHSLCLGIFVLGLTLAYAGQESALGSPSAPTVATQSTTREQRIAEWLAKTEWPKNREILRICSAELPRMYLAGVGRTEKLGPGWATGNQYWELAHAAVVEAVRAEELRGGPLIPEDAHVYAKLVQALNFTDEEIAFLDRFTTTPYGQAYIELLDHLGAAMRIAQLSAVPEIPEETKLRLQALGPRLLQEMSGVLARFAEAEKKQKADEDRMEAILGRVDPENNHLLKQLMGEILSDASQRIKGALFRLDLLRTIWGQVAAFRASQALPAAGKSGS